MPVLAPPGAVLAPELGLLLVAVSLVVPVVLVSVPVPVPLVPDSPLPPEPEFWLQATRPSAAHTMSIVFFIRFCLSSSLTPIT